jgi:hypothetical protein
MGIWLAVIVYLKLVTTGKYLTQMLLQKCPKDKNSNQSKGKLIFVTVRRELSTLDKYCTLSGILTPPPFP